MTISRDVLRINAELDRLLAVDLDSQEAVLVEAFADVLRVTTREAEAIAQAMVEAAADGRSVAGLVARDARVQAALEAIRTAIDQTLATSLAQVGYTSTLRAAEGTEAMIAAQLTGPTRAALKASLVSASPEQITAITLRTTERIAAQSRPLSALAEQAMRRELRRGVALGENPRQSARRMVRALEDASDMTLARAMTIARTETIDAHRAAAQTVEEANTDVLAGWEWYTHADERTCRSCLAQHGRRFSTEEPGPLDHPNGRCSRIPVTKSWEELGFSGMREPKRAMETGEELFAAMSDEEQRSVLGPQGYAAWKRGDYPMEEWSALRKNADWRDSYTQTRPPK
ncbi:phage minor head protein [Brachybacterium nesterenkovii]|uniref:phage minor head protein n=1 Tax=Brachybacterium nesterenkovii TaxID=47847 RepID=UPI003219851F